LRIPLKIGIRNLVEFSCRAGDLGFDGGPVATGQQGLVTHKKIQQRYKKQALAEYTIKYTTEIDEFDIELSGRIDLLFDTESPPRIEEIKTVYSHIHQQQDEASPTHWAQVKCYAACYAQLHDLDEINVSLNYVSLFNYHEFRQQQLESASALNRFLQQVLKQYTDWLRLVHGQQQSSRITARELNFPFDSFRSQQREFAAQVYRNIQLENRLMVEAPTGSGKTMSTLFPAIKALGEDLADQVIYLSAKTSGQNEALKAADLMISQSLDLSYLVIQAKAKSCPCAIDESEFDADGKCRRCVGFFDRLGEARENLITRRRLNIEAIQVAADAYQLCPFELSLQMLPWSDLVVCDLNYVFDPLVQLSYFKTDSKRKVLLIDEFHNLVDRARGMYSASITRSQIKQAIFSAHNKSLRKSLTSIQSALNKSVRDLALEEQVGDEVPKPLVNAITRFVETVGIELFGSQRIARETLDLAKALFRFQCISNLYYDHHKTISKKPAAEREVKLTCLNAFEFLATTYPLFQSVCGFSATLSPASYFTRALGLGEQAFALQLESAFPAERLNVCLCSYIDTRYRQRDLYLDQICATIDCCYQTKRGNYLVFFSSYFFMQKVHQRFAELYPDTATIIQHRAPDDQQRTDFLAQFFDRNDSLGFAIMGGIYAEGIDYHGHALIGAIIVGVGLPQANTEQQLIEADFNALELNGFDYAYRFPGLIRVQQSGGRVIRSDSDRGVIILLDRRFGQAGYRQQLPRHWRAQQTPTLNALKESLSGFWDHS
jgi:Rad3-related DNA helicase